MIQEFPCDERWTPMVGDEIWWNGKHERTIVSVNKDGSFNSLEKDYGCVLESVRKHIYKLATYRRNIPDPVETPPPTNAYLRKITATNGPDRGKSLSCDIYDIITAFGVTNVGQIQAVKKVLRGGRADKDWRKDMEEAILCLQRAIEIEGVK